MVLYNDIFISIQIMCGIGQEYTGQTHVEKTTALVCIFIHNLCFLKKEEVLNRF